MGDKYAIISVTDKSGLTELAEVISTTHSIISSGGTAKVLEDAGIPVIRVSDYTGFPELFDGRVKTLHPKIHGGILFRDIPEHRAQQETHEIEEIDIVVVNLYDFVGAIEENPREENIVEHIDIGGPTLLRAAAKNYERVTVLSDPEDYQVFMDKFPEISFEDRISLAAKAFALVTAYDIEITKYMNKVASVSQSFFTEKLDNNYFLKGKLASHLRYGENPHQEAAYFTAEYDKFYDHLHGREPSYNNLLDIVAGIYLVKEFSEPACVIIKHRTPCGVASASTLKQAYLDALRTDKMSAYGGVYCFNKKIDLETAEELKEMFVDTLIAPDYESSALEILKEKEKMTILRREAGPDIYQEITSVPGGFVVQDRDISHLTSDQVIEVSQLKPDSIVTDELYFAWNVVKHSRSNAIAICTGTRALGIGSGQTSRVDAVKQAIQRSGNEVRGAVLASDAFFPFPDSIKLAAEAGIKAIISPQGSIRDQEVIQAADEAGIVLVFTKIRSFKH